MLDSVSSVRLSAARSMRWRRSKSSFSASSIAFWMSVYSATILVTRPHASVKGTIVALTQKSEPSLARLRKIPFQMAPPFTAAHRRA